MKIEISGTVEEVKTQVALLHATFNGGGTVVTGKAELTLEGAGTHATEKDDKPAGKRGKAASKEKEAPAKEAPVANGEAGEAVMLKGGEVQNKAAETPAATALTLDNVRAALTLLTSKINLEAGKTTLAKHGADRMSALTQDKYAAFIADCEAQVADKVAAADLMA